MSINRKKVKVLFIQEFIPAYRIPLFKGLSDAYDITIAFSKNCCDDRNLLKTINISFPTVREWKEMSMSEFESITNEIIELVTNYDVTVIPLVPHRKSLCFIDRVRHHSKVIVWGIGVAGSYDIRYDSVQYTSPSFESIISMSDAAIFYSDYPVKKYLKHGLPAWKMFVANNTVDVIKYDINNSKKDSIIFVGSLLRQKRIDLLLDAYQKACVEIPDLFPLKIIGEGDEYTTIKDWIRENNMEERILLLGAIYDEERISKEYLSAYLSVSSDQAGLSVLKSMGYGVPFAAHVNSITGGEIFNIDNGETGIVFENYDDLKDVIIDVYENPRKYLIMGNKAYEYYYSCRTMDDYIREFSNALDYVIGGS